MHLGKMKLVPSGGYNLLDIRDFSTAVVNSLEKGRSGEVYLAGGNYISLKELARLANPGASTYKVSIDLLQFLLPLLEPLKPFIPSLQEMNRESLSTLKNAPRSVDSSRAQNLLGLKSRPAKETVEDLISWMKIREE